MAPGEDTGSRCGGKGPLVYQEGGLRKRIFLAVSTSDLATRNRIFLPPCRIRSTALKPRGGDGAEEPAAAMASASPRLRMQDWLAGAPPHTHALPVLCYRPGMARTSCSSHPSGCCRSLPEFGLPVITARQMLQGSREAGSVCRVPGPPEVCAGKKQGSQDASGADTCSPQQRPCTTHPSL